MPEIKQNFTKGKMNKDLDERLVPKGEYIHAMNVQVSSSDGNNVGSLQNILGNKNITLGVTNAQQGELAFPPGSRCVGAIADEKNDLFYWFVTSNNADMILRKKVDGALIEVVFYDANKSVLKFGYTNLITGINIIDDLLFWTDNATEPKKINIKRCLENTNLTGSTDLTNLAHTQLALSSGTTIDIREEHITVIRKPPTKALNLTLKTNRPKGNIRNNNFNFQADGMTRPVLWSGIVTTQDQQASTLPIDYGIHQVTYVDGTTSPANTVDNFSGAQVGEKYWVRIREGINTATGLFPDHFELDWIQGITGGGGSQASGGNTPWAGRKVVLKPFTNNNTTIPSQPITSYTIKGVLTDSYNTNQNYLISLPSLQTTTTNHGILMVEFTITDIDGDIPSIDTAQTLNWVIDLFDETEKLFEFKFPRFSYRYKYEDNEYSSFAPWTEVAFVPGAFDYHPKKGYNLGMVNKLSSVVLGDFVAGDISEEVKEVDILYKEEGSTTVYVVENIKRGELKTINVGLSTFNHWDLNYYEVFDETINTVVPQNQSLRPWDNVPVKALAQEVTGNRIVYANYFQNHSLDVMTSGTNTGQFYPKLSPSIYTDTAGGADNYAAQSIKSLREYQLGVLFVDKYGRETPILTNPNAAFKLDKKAASSANKLEVTLNNFDNFLDNEITYYKFFIKETAGEYYNMAMDRWYDAEDGNRWLSFPSSDRNKIDIDTFLILKKATKSSSLITEPARYNVLAIENEAPDFIKIRKNIIDSQVHLSATPIFDNAQVSGQPFEGENQLTLLYANFANSSGAWLHDLKEGELYLEFGKVGGGERSNRYRITEITKTNASGTEQYNLTLDNPLKSDVNFIDDGTGTAISDNTTARFYHYTLENAAKFDGRFFVKIYADDVFKVNFETKAAITSTVEYNTVASRIQYSMHPDLSTTHDSTQTGLDQGDYANHAFGNFAPYFREYSTKDDAYQWPTWQPVTVSGNNPNALEHDNWGAPINIGRYKFGPSNARNNAAMYIARHPGSNSAAHGIDTRMPDWWREALHGTIPTLFEMPTQDFLTYGTYVYQSTHSQYPGNNYLPSGATTGATFGAYTWGSDTMWHQPHKEPRPFKGANARMTSTEVWFVDSGPWDGEDGGGSGLDWPGNSGAGSNSGISSLSGSDYKMTLGFGPIYFEANTDFVKIDATSIEFSGGQNSTFTSGYGESYNYEGGDNNFNSSNWMGAGGDQANEFWNIGKNTNAIYGDTSTVNWVDQMTGGKQFKWADDPYETIHTITSVNTKNLFNYQQHRDGPLTLPGGSPSMLTPIPESCFALPVNFRRNWELTIEPANPTWVPDTGGFTPIMNGYSLAINARTSGTTFDSNTTSVLEDYCIYLTSNVADCSVTNEEDVPIKVGMIVDKYNNDSVFLNSFVGITATAPYLLVKEVTNFPTYTRVKLCGYSNALLASHCITPTAGQTVRFQQAAMNGYSPNSAKRISLNSSDDYSDDLLRAVGYEMEFIEITETQGEILLPENPAIWETEPKDESDLDIYHEISGYNAWKINKDTIATQVPIGSTVRIIPITAGPGFMGIVPIPQQSSWDPGVSFATVTSVSETWYNNGIITVDESTLGVRGAPWNAILEITRPDGSSFRTTCGLDPDPINSALAIGPTAAWGATTSNPSNFDFMIPLSTQRASHHRLNWYNCYSFLNGVESNRIRDNFNLPFISNGVRVSTVFDEPIVQEHRKSGLIYSGIYNSNSGVNETNQFIQALKITKDVNPIYGSIQKLHSRDSDLVTLCEDKCLRILANKDAVYNADGNPQLTANINVLGQTIPFVGEYGISKNPESFASESYRAYFTDKVRGAVMRLSKDGLTPISEHGMKDWFRDNLKLGNTFLGSYDDKKGEYNIKLDRTTIEETGLVWVEALIGSGSAGYYSSTPATYSSDPIGVVSFSEQVKGWVSFKSFVDMEWALSCANEYYTINNGAAWQHHVEIPGAGNIIDNYNTFYNVFQPSRVDFYLNDIPSSVKSFKTLNYEGTRSRIVQLAPGVPIAQDFFGNAIPSNTAAGWHDNLSYNETAAEGWYCNSIVTDLEKGAVDEFIKKEGKYFNYIKGAPINYNSLGEITSNFDTGSLRIQGLGFPTETPILMDAFGCMDEFDAITGVANFNYNPAATIDAINSADTSGVTTCIPGVLGCTDLNAYSYNPSANTDDGSCIYLGCTDSGVISAAFSAGTPWNGISYDDPTSNYIWNDLSPNPSVMASNYDVVANMACGSSANTPYTTTNDYADYNGCCTYIFTGCTDNTAINYDDQANTPCNANNTASGNNECCIPVVPGCMDLYADNYNSSANIDDLGCEYSGCMDLSADNYLTPQDASSPYLVSTAFGANNHMRGFIEALAGQPDRVDDPMNDYWGVSSATSSGCGWSFYPEMFGSSGLGTPVGVGVLIPQLTAGGVASDSCSGVEPILNSNPSNAGCDSSIPYQAILPVQNPIDHPLLTFPSSFSEAQFGAGAADGWQDMANAPTTSPFAQWPDISYALDINGNQIPFTHQWYAADGFTYQPLQYLVNPLPPCPNVSSPADCVIPAIGGCMDAAAANYDPFATFEFDPFDPLNPDMTNAAFWCKFCGVVDKTVNGVLYPSYNYDGAVDAAGAPYGDGCVYCTVEIVAGSSSFSNHIDSSGSLTVDWEFTHDSTETSLTPADIGPIEIRETGNAGVSYATPGPWMDAGVVITNTVSGNFIQSHATLGCGANCSDPGNVALQLSAGNFIYEARVKVSCASTSTTAQSIVTTQGTTTFFSYNAQQPTVVTNPNWVSGCVIEAGGNTLQTPRLGHAHYGGVNAITTLSGVVQNTQALGLNPESVLFGAVPTSQFSPNIVNGWTSYRWTAYHTIHTDPIANPVPGSQDVIEYYSDSIGLPADMEWGPFNPSAGWGDNGADIIQANGGLPIQSADFTFAANIPPPFNSTHINAIIVPHDEIMAKKMNYGDPLAGIFTGNPANAPYYSPTYNYYGRWNLVVEFTCGNTVTNEKPAYMRSETYHIGCMNPAAVNYDADATWASGGCIFAIP